MLAQYLPRPLAPNVEKELHGLVERAARKAGMSELPDDGLTTLRRGLDSRPGAVIESENRAVSCSNYCAVQKVAKPLTVENIVRRLGALYRIQNWYTV